MHTWHDFHITGYSVDGKRRAIVFHLESPIESMPGHSSGTRSDEPARGSRVQLRFEGVEGYFLEHDLRGNIVYAFEEIPLRPFLEQWADTFTKSSQWGWPLFWTGGSRSGADASESVEAAFQHLSARGVMCVELSSSYGLSGWVLATSVEHEVLDEPHAR
ncbi:hypothetical protein [Roseateles terrae]|uniref:Integron gene cassette protein n=1 Tax=Roseateles terrae TaxID=431060 RepID=A0ABR6GP57_9BURK|nr:hypothetical protein [Roseateles terrae]MBB3193893.1 hypothetical protein [Roseateles terrae]OWQ87775.1 hypothetical protein CDN98_06310 [Roseateles terrae]